MASYTMDKLGNPSEEYYKGVVHSSMIYHFPAIPGDIDTANNIFSRKFPYLKGKIFRRHTPEVVLDYIPIPI